MDIGLKNCFRLFLSEALEDCRGNHVSLSAFRVFNETGFENCEIHHEMTKSLKSLLKEIALTS